MCRARYLIDHLLLLEELLIRLLLEGLLLLHLLVEGRAHRGAVLVAQVVPIRLRLQAALPVGLHLLGHDGLRLRLLGDQRGGLLDLRLALLVHVRGLELLLELAQLLRLLADPLHVLRLAHRLRVSPRALRCQPLVLLAQDGLAVLRGGGDLQRLRGVHVLRREPLLVHEPPPVDAVVGAEVLGELLVAGEVRRERLHLVVGLALDLELHIVASLLRHGCCGCCWGL